MAHALETRFREQTGLAVTIAVHIGMAALVLIGFHTVTAPPARPPLITSAIPAPPLAQPVDPVPTTHDQQIITNVQKPIYDTERATADPVVRADTGDEPVVVAADGKQLSDSGPPTTVKTSGPTSAAKLDQRYASDFQPPYPASEERLGVSGSVIVHVRIGTDGRVVAASVAHSSGSARLDQAAVTQALKKWRFVAALQDGVAVETERDITVTFRLTASGW